MEPAFWMSDQGNLLLNSPTLLIGDRLDTVQYGEDFTHGFDTQNNPKLQASLGTQPENTHGIQRQTQPNPYTVVWTATDSIVENSVFFSKGTNYKI